jgi:hypothetical protein
MPDRKKDIMNNNPMNNATEVKTVQVDLNKVFKTFYSNYLLDNPNMGSQFLISLLINPETEEILVVKNHPGQNLSEMANNKGLVFVGSIDVNKVLLDDEDVLIAAKDFVNLPKYQKTLKDEALEFVAEAAKELFVFQLEEKQSAEQMDEVETFNSQQSSLKNPVEEFALLSNEFYNSDKLSEEVMNSPLFEIVVTSILNFQIGEGLDKVFLLDKLVKSDVISQDLFLDKVSQFIQMEEDALFSDIDVLKTLIKRLPSLEVIKTGFNKSSKTKVKNFIELLGGLIVRLGSEELVFLLNESFFGSK